MAMSVEYCLNIYNKTTIVFVLGCGYNAILYSSREHEDIHEVII